MEDKELQMAISYTRSAFALMERKYPVKENGTLDVMLAIDMCHHWASLETGVAPLDMWIEAKHPEYVQEIMIKNKVRTKLDSGVYWNPEIIWPPRSA